MNDLDIVRDLRSQVRQTEERDLREARRRLLVSMTRVPRTRKLPRTVFRVAATGALALAIAAGVTVVQNLGTDGPGTGPASPPAWVPVANAETLAKRATAAAAGTTDVYPRADQWIYVKRESFSSPKVMDTSDVPSTGGGKTESRHVEEVWIRGDGKERARRKEGSKTVTRIHGGEDSRRRFDPDYLRSLPLEPSALRQRLQKDMEDVTPLRGERAVFSQVSFILQEGAPPARLRAALYTVISQLDGVGVEQKVRDVVGREGVGLYMDADVGRREVIIDPKSYDLLGGRLIYLGGAEKSSPFARLTPGEVVSSIAQVAYGIVDHAGDIS
ncbi:CU044_5270 family protein [Nonomuraea sp. NEAU-A123]|uniref:CU044_5270 family protein n=1 Tax=Nonomuraea sp. NEAU-A123 TaxID=2839649 RepID=UPI001BE41E54|nr:CU044_5270 family protein [Nonomuraea sp. NEAU-A123]MBT2233933.1 CU044_5270 family protein [Nonomuraea sp. NEAU-A123]